MTIEKVKLTDFTMEELQAVYIVLELGISRSTNDFKEKHSETIKIFKTQLVNAATQRKEEEQILKN